ncbi:hypothetical protein ACS0TY_011663 [Phlomoides rotata]
MGKMGFADTWIKLILKCIKSVSYSFKVNGRIVGNIEQHRGSPCITHFFFFFFADDSLVFFKANPRNCLNLKECLSTYEAASGQLINYDKSVLKPNTNFQSKSLVKDMLNIQISREHDIYMGVPIFSLRNKMLQFGFLNDQILKKIVARSSKFFSEGGREVLIKAVLRDIPTYVISCFRIHPTLCEEIERICANFWWGAKEYIRKQSTLEGVRLTLSPQK